MYVCKKGICTCRAIGSILQNPKFEIEHYNKYADQWDVITNLETGTTRLTFSVDGERNIFTHAIETWLDETEGRTVIMTHIPMDRNSSCLKHQENDAVDAIIEYSRNHAWAYVKKDEWWKIDNGAHQCDPFKTRGSGYVVCEGMFREKIQITLKPPRNSVLNLTPGHLPEIPLRILEHHSVEIPVSVTIQRPTVDVPVVKVPVVPVVKVPVVKVPVCQQISTPGESIETDSTADISLILQTTGDIVDSEWNKYHRKIFDEFATDIPVGVYRWSINPGYYITASDPVLGLTRDPVEIREILKKVVRCHSERGSNHVHFTENVPGNGRIKKHQIRGIVLHDGKFDGCMGSCGIGRRIHMRK